MSNEKGSVMFEEVWHGSRAAGAMSKNTSTSGTNKAYCDQAVKIHKVEVGCA